MSCMLSWTLQILTSLRISKTKKMRYLKMKMAKTKANPRYKLSSK